jgi:hypothetical protein
MYIMKKMILSLALLAAVAATPAFAATVTTNASVTIVAPASVTKNSDLQFGSIVRPATGTNTVTVDVNGTRTITGAGDGALIASTTNRASYTATGAIGQMVTISTPPTVTLVFGANTIPVTLTPSSTGFTFASPSTSFSVGGSLTLDSTAVAGAYTGSFVETITYN